jgi:hypothetical protein
VARPPAESTPLMGDGVGEWREGVEEWRAGVLLAEERVACCGSTTDRSPVSVIVSAEPME